MRELLRSRLNKLQGEYEQGQKMLADLETRQAELRGTVLRISGAIQVLEELLAVPTSASDSGDAAAEADPVNGHPPR